MKPYFYFLIILVCSYLGFASLKIYSRLKILRSMLYEGIMCFVIVIVSMLSLFSVDEKNIFMQFLLILVIIFGALWGGRATTVESGLYSTMRKKGSRYDLLVGKIPPVLETGEITPNISWKSGLMWGGICMFASIVVPFISGKDIPNPLVFFVSVSIIYYSFKLS